MFQQNLPQPLSLSAENDRELRNSWEEVVQDYTRRALTKPGDRLLACSGLADQFSRFWPGRYLAGLWQRTLLAGLLWLKDYQELFPRPAKYRAPSWSWAAVDGRVVLYRPDSDLDPDRVHVNACEILHGEVTLANELRPFGQVTAGALTVKAVLKEMLWDPTAQTPQLFEETGPVLDTELGSAKRAPVGTVYVDTIEDVTKAVGNVWAVPIQWTNGFEHAVGLLVIPVDSDDSYVRRVGYFSSDAKDSPFKAIEPNIITIV